MSKAATAPVSPPIAIPVREILPWSIFAILLRKAEQPGDEPAIMPRQDGEEDWVDCLDDAVSALKLCDP